MSACEPALATHALTKCYAGRAVVDHLDLTVPTGSVFGFLGRNGAGKTTTIRMLLGLARPTSGTIDLTRPGAVGFLPDVPGFHPWMRAEEVLAHAGRLAGLDAATVASRTATLLDLAGLAGVTQRTSAYSRGMRQRLGLARALVTAPPLVVMDEPTSALDPISTSKIEELASELKKNYTIVIVTHNMQQAVRISDQTAFFLLGELIEYGNTEELFSQPKEKKTEDYITGRFG